eukprot:360335-Chlamydomonas_euryale.AAC.3
MKGDGDKKGLHDRTMDHIVNWRCSEIPGAVPATLRRIQLHFQCGKYELPTGAKLSKWRCARGTNYVESYHNPFH